MYLLISVIFIAELIITFTLIRLIVRLDRKVNYYNCCVLTFNPLLKTILEYTRCVVSNFKNSFEKIISFVEKKREQLIYRTIIVIAVYVFLFLFKFNTKKASKIYKLVGVIRDLALELAV